MRPDILGISTDSTAESALAIFQSAFKGRVAAVSCGPSFIRLTAL
jgi:hypothetical protein